MAILVAAIVNNAKVQSDKLADTSIAPGDYVTIVNRKVESLYRLIVSLDREAYFTQGDFTLTGTAAGAQKDLSTVTGLSAFRALHGVDFNPDTSTRMTIGRRNFRERNVAAVGWWLPASLAPDRRYDLRGRTLVVSPYEVAAGPYRAYARVGPYQFTDIADATALDWQLEPYVEWIEIMSARDALGIEESDTGYKSERLAELKTEITAAHGRDDAEPAVIADVEEDNWRPW